jgi:hypothetical protein
LILNRRLFNHRLLESDNYDSIDFRQLNYNKKTFYDYNNYKINHNQTILWVSITSK